MFVIAFDRRFAIDPLPGKKLAFYRIAVIIVFIKVR